MTAATPGREELLACPFCGGPAIFERPGNARQSCVIKCEDCGCKLETGEVFHQGTAWNTRVAAKPAEREPDFIYDPDDWEWTSEYKSRNDLAESAEVERGDVKRFCTLINGPDKFCALVPTDQPDEAGDHHEWEHRWFDSEAEARASTPSEPKP